jgi:hypothetical protein
MHLGAQKFQWIILNAMLHGFSGGQNEIFRRGVLQIDDCENLYFAFELPPLAASFPA